MIVGIGSNPADESLAQRWQTALQQWLPTSGVYVKRQNFVNRDEKKKILS